MENCTNWLSCRTGLSESVVSCLTLLFVLGLVWALWFRRPKGYNPNRVSTTWPVGHCRPYNAVIDWTTMSKIEVPTLRVYFETNDPDIVHNRYSGGYWLEQMTVHKRGAIVSHDVPIYPTFTSMVQRFEAKDFVETAGLLAQAHEYNGPIEWVGEPPE